MARFVAGLWPFDRRGVAFLAAVCDDQPGDVSQFCVGVLRIAPQYIKGAVGIEIEASMSTP